MRWVIKEYFLLINLESVWPSPFVLAERYTVKQVRHTELNLLEFFLLPLCKFMISPFSCD